MTYPIPPSDRAVGQGNPPADMNDVSALLGFITKTTPGNSATAVPAGRGATLTVAASNSSAGAKRNADYVCIGVSDETVINTAISALPGIGGRVVLLEGQYIRTGSVIIDQSFVILEGQGSAATNLTASLAGVTGPAVVVGNTKALSASGVKGMQITDTNGSGVPVSGSTHGVVFAVNAGIIEDVVVQPVPGDEFHLGQDLVNFALNTSVAAGSNGASLPVATLNVGSTAGFAANGSIMVATSSGPAWCTYTSTVGGNSFTGCTWSFPGTSATLATGGKITQPGFLFDLTAIQCYAQKQNAVTGNGWYLDYTYSSCEMYACRTNGALSKPGSTGSMNGFLIYGGQVKLYGCHGYFYNGYALQLGDRHVFTAANLSVFGGEWETNATGGMALYNSAGSVFLNGLQFYANGTGTGQQDIFLFFGSSRINILGCTFSKGGSGNLAQNIYMQHASYVYIDHCEFDYPVIARAILVDGSGGAGNACSYIFIRDNRCVAGSVSSNFVQLSGAVTNCEITGNVTDASIIESVSTGTPNSNIIRNNTIVPGFSAVITTTGPQTLVWDNPGWTGPSHPEWINVVASLGADPSGVNDSTAALSFTGPGPYYIPAGTYKITSALNWKIAKLRVITDGAALTTIQQATANTGGIFFAGQAQIIDPLTIRYPSQEPSANTSSICAIFGDDTVGDSFLSEFRGLRCYLGATGMAINPAITTKAGLFSCYFGNTEVFGYSVSAINFNGGNGVGAGGTGCVMDNTYIHNNFSGSDVSSTAHVVNIQNFQEFVFNQLNIEHAQTFSAVPLQFAEVGNAVINGLHLEHLEVSGTSPGWGLVGVGTQTGCVTINGYSVRFCTFTGTTSNAMIQVTGGSAQTVIVNGFSMPTSDGGNSTPTLALVDFGSATGALVTFSGIATSPAGPLASQVAINAGTGSKLVLAGLTQSLLATTGDGGVALINGTQTFLTWTAPNDGQLHRIEAFVALQVTSSETGGAIGLGWTQPSGNVQSAAAQLFAGGLSNGPQWTTTFRLVAPNTTVTIQQTSALTVGASVLWAELWGS